VLPIVDFMVRKKIEVDNIRIIARGKESGLDSEQIKKLLVI
jgi:V/A-type H+-transporting ATPase subunit C